ncbi:hypothetical protein [Mesobacterium pallidum]|uniref:hypothetical protein n=1 Tax=Mesobacterium pallidum TaxID=2872037 RepID=UPI001EE1F350|nr:hypothetical protein [Mesobacterium pallidum]
MPPNAKDTRLTIRLTPEERLALEAKAGDRALSAFVRDLALAEAANKRANTRVPAASSRELAQVLALLGQSGALQGLDRLGAAATNGIVALDEVERGQIDTARAEIGEIRALLMQALRVKSR